MIYYFEKKEIKKNIKVGKVSFGMRNLEERKFVEQLSWMCFLKRR